MGEVQRPAGLESDDERLGGIELPAAVDDAGEGAAIGPGGFDAAGGHLFSGDALFSLGVGRMFEGTPGPLWQGLAALRALPTGSDVHDRST